VTVFDFLARLLGKKPTRPPPSRLSSDEAIAIARRAVAGDPVAEDLALAKFELRSGKAVWVVSSATVGSMLEISIDDATGQVLEQKYIGMR
jgi:uncharacterized membrane protein YkoI